MRIEDKVAKNEHKYRQLAPKTFADTVWVIDAIELTIIYISPSVKQLRGYSYKDLVGKPIKNIIAPDSYQNIIAMLKTAIQGFHQNISKTHKIEVEIYQKNNEKIWIELTAKIIKEDDENLKIVGLSNNITKLKAKESESDILAFKLEKALAEKEQLMKEIKQFETLLPICSACRRIRHANNSWWPIEKYIEEKAGSQFTHTICPDCTKLYYDK